MLWEDVGILGGVLIVCGAVSWLASSPPREEGRADDGFDVAGGSGGWVTAGDLAGSGEDSESAAEVEAAGQACSEHAGTPKTSAPEVFGASDVGTGGASFDVVAAEVIPDVTRAEEVESGTGRLVGSGV